MPSIGKQKREQSPASPGPAGEAYNESPWPPMRSLGSFESTVRFPLAQVFPAELQWCQDFLLAVGESTQVPVDLPAMLMLPIAAVAAAGAFRCHVQGDWFEPSALWTLTLLSSGERKSAVLSEMTAPIKYWEREMAADASGERTRAKVRLQATCGQIKRMMEKAEKKGITTEEENQIVALEQQKEQLEDSLSSPRIYTDEATTEAMAQLMLNSGGRLLVAAAEADAFDVMLGRYSRTPNFGVWLKGQAGETIPIDRKEKSIQIPSPALSLAMTVQAGSIGELYRSDQARDRGFLARILPSCPPSMMGYRKMHPAPVPHDLREHYQDTLTAMLRERSSRVTGDRAGLNPVGLSPGARDLFTGFRESIERELREGGELTYDTGWGSKLPGQIARIALALHCLQQFGKSAIGGGGRVSPEIGPEIMRAALALGDYLMAQNLLVNQRTAQSSDDDMARKVLGWIKREGRPRFTLRELYQANKDKKDHQRTEDFESVLGILLEHAIIREIAPEGQTATGRPQGGGKAARHFAVSPYALQPAPGEPVETLAPLEDDPNGRSDDD